MKKLRMKLPTMFRDLDLDRAAIDKEKRTVAVSFSSEIEVERWFGKEILDHSKGAVDLGRLTKVGSVLVDHASRDLVGTVEQAAIGEDRIGRAIVRFGRSARAEEIFQDVTDGIRKAISVGYRINTLKLEKSDKETGVDTYRATKWTPHEISFVGVPADHTVGVGRADVADAEDVFIEVNDMEQNEMKRKFGKLMDGLRVRGLNVEQEGAANGQAAGAGAAPPQQQQQPPAAAQRTDVAQEAQNAIVDKERARCKALDDLGKVYEKHGGKELARDMILSGRTPDDFKNVMLERIGTRDIPAVNIGMTQKEVKHYSILRAINAIANPNDRAAREAAAFEFECSAAALKQEKRDLRTGGQIAVPTDVAFGPLQRNLNGWQMPTQQRDLIVGTGTMGGFTVATDLVSFVEMFRNRLALAQAGAQMLTGLQGMVAIPKQTGGATAYWVGENVAPTESQPVFGQLTMTPKTVGAYTDMSRRLIIQSSIDVENFVKTDLAKVLALAVDLAGLSGPGTGNQPSGILASTSIGSSTAGAAGGAPTWAQVVALETAVAAANADVPSSAYLMNAVTRGKLKTVQKGTNLPFIWEPDNTLNGYRTVVSNQLRSNLTKGTSTGILSEMLFGNFSDYIIGMWGGLDLMVDPYSGATAGTLRVIVLQDVDVVMRHVESFAVTPDLITT
jgi:HK97 family phage major capsid protein